MGLDLFLPKHENLLVSPRPLRPRRLYWGSGPPTCHERGGDICVELTVTHSFNCLSAACERVIWACGDASVPPPLMIFTRAASRPVCAPEDPERGIRTAVPPRERLTNAPRQHTHSRESPVFLTCSDTLWGELPPSLWKPQVADQNHGGVQSR